MSPELVVDFTEIAWNDDASASEHECFHLVVDYMLLMACQNPECLFLPNEGALRSFVVRNGAHLQVTY